MCDIIPDGKLSKLRKFSQAIAQASDLPLLCS